MPDRIFLAGDSGGGGLANTLLLANPEYVKPVHPAGLVLFSPEVDLRLDEKSVTENAELTSCRGTSPPPRLHGFDPRRVRLARDRGSQGFPPTCVSWERQRVFRDPIRRYVQRLRGRGMCRSMPWSTRACSTSSRS